MNPVACELANVSGASRVITANTVSTLTCLPGDVVVLAIALSINLLRTMPF